MTRILHTGYKPSINNNSTVSEFRKMSTNISFIEFLFISIASRFLFIILALLVDLEVVHSFKMQ